MNYWSTDSDRNCARYLTGGAHRFWSLRVKVPPPYCSHDRGLTPECPQEGRHGGWLKYNAIGKEWSCESHRDDAEAETDDEPAERQESPEGAVPAARTGP